MGINKYKCVSCGEKLAAKEVRDGGGGLPHIVYENGQDAYVVFLRTYSDDIAGAYRLKLDEGVVPRLTELKKELKGIEDLKEEYSQIIIKHKFDEWCDENAKQEVGVRYKMSDFSGPAHAKCVQALLGSDGLENVVHSDGERIESALTTITPQQFVEVFKYFIDVMKLDFAPLEDYQIKLELVHFSKYDSKDE